MDCYHQNGINGDVDLTVRQHTGANLADIAMNRVFQGIVTQDANCIKKAIFDMMEITKGRAVSRTGTGYRDMNKVIDTMLQVIPYMDEQNAKKVYDDKNSTIQELEAAIKQLKNAIQQLVKVQEKGDSLPMQPIQEAPKEVKQDKDNTPGTGEQVHTSMYPGGFLLADVVRFSIYLKKKELKNKFNFIVCLLTA